MRQVLIIEDNPIKQNAIKGVIEGAFKAKVLAAASISLAYPALSMQVWDLIILDMTFQASGGAGREISKEALAGVEVLQYIQRTGIEAPVLVATQHTTFLSKEFPDINSVEKLHEILRDGFPSAYRETVRIDLASDAWKAELCGAIRRVWGTHGAA
jgi:CheY-like chemotaxis protein